ncbi:hypothetical protein CsSME_00045140 [Camellia sinensis var. sinensis]
MKWWEEERKVFCGRADSFIALMHLVQGVMHRDLKPENFLFLSTDEDSPLKATDFGLSLFYKSGYCNTWKKNALFGTCGRKERSQREGESLEVLLGWIWIMDFG